MRQSQTFSEKERDEPTAFVAALHAQHDQIKTRAAAS